MARVPVLAGDAGQELLDRAMRQAEAGNEEGTSPLDPARVITEQARHLITRGEPAQAEQALQQAHQLFTTAGAEDEAATVMGIIADIAYDRGELDEALRIRREIELPALERLGDTRSAAVTWGQIADIAYQSGELDEAAELQHKRLEVNKQLGDLDGIAAATWDLAQIDLTREDRRRRQHPGLVEELSALKAWREEIYEASQPSGQAARYWHTELRQVLQAATTIYAAGCRTGHRGARSTAADDARLQQRWAAASPLAGISATCLNAGQQQNRPGHWLSQAVMAEALDNGSAQPLSTALPDHICWAGTWWRPDAGGWTRVTEAGLVARLSAWAAQLTEPDTHGSGRQPGRAAPGGDADQHTDGPVPGESNPGGSGDGQE